MGLLEFLNHGKDGVNTKSEKCAKNSYFLYPS